MANMQIKTCVMCGKILGELDLQENFSVDLPHIGYGSKFDLCHVKFDLCCDCFDKTIEWMQSQSVSDPVVNYDIKEILVGQVFFKGVFWIVDKTNLCNNGKYMFKLPVDCRGNNVDIKPSYPPNSKSGYGYNHRLVWRDYVSQKDKQGKSYNYYPRGRVEIADKKAKVYINSTIATSKIINYIIEIFAIDDLDVKVIVDGSAHYKCYGETKWVPIDKG